MSVSVCVYVCRFAETLTLSEKNTNYPTVIGVVRMLIFLSGGEIIYTHILCVLCVCVHAQGCGWKL